MVYLKKLNQLGHLDLAGNEETETWPGNLAMEPEITTPKNDQKVEVKKPGQNLLGNFDRKRAKKQE